MYFTPHYRDGVTRCAFDLHVEPGGEFYQEWRDSESPYRTGPSRWVSGGKLRAAGKELLAVPSGQWVHFEISAGLGSQSTATWVLSATLPGQTAKKFTGLFCHPQWKGLDWLGFVSNANGKTVYYLDNLTLRSEAR